MEEKWENLLANYKEKPFSEDIIKDIDNFDITMEFVRNLVVKARVFYKILTDKYFDKPKDFEEDIKAFLIILSEKPKGIKRFFPFAKYIRDIRLANYLERKYKDIIISYKERKKFIVNAVY